MPIPSDSFRLTVENVNPYPDADFRFSLFTIHASRAASISIDGPDGAHRGQKLSDAPDGVVREGKVSLSAARVAPSQEKFAYIQTLINPYAEHLASQFGGPSVHRVPAETKLEDFFSISAASGVYKLDTPVVIAQKQGKPVTLVVGKPTR
jgi:hypothetical protein